MQISASNLLATQSQTMARSRANAPAFEPISFKEAPAASITPTAAQPGASTEMTPATGDVSYGGGYVRPGTNLDIKI